MSEHAHDPSFENPYRAPTAPLAEPAPTISAEGTEEHYLRVFVGGKSDYYLRKWSPLSERSGQHAGFNWAAFLLTGLWLPYRKMYAVTMIYFAVILVESIAEELFFIVILGEPEAPAALSQVTSLVAAVICGAYGNRWYLSHARKVVADVRAQQLDEQATVELLAKRGGTSLGASLGLFLLYVIVIGVVFVAIGTFL